MSKAWKVGRTGGMKWIIHRMEELGKPNWFEERKERREEARKTEGRKKEGDKMVYRVLGRWRNARHFYCCSYNLNWLRQSVRDSSLCENTLFQKILGRWQSRLYQESVSPCVILERKEDSETQCPWNTPFHSQEPKQVREQWECPRLGCPDKYCLKGWSLPPSPHLSFCFFYLYFPPLSIAITCYISSALSLLTFWTFFNWLPHFLFSWWTIFSPSFRAV